MYRTHIVYQLWVILTLVVLIGVPIAILATRLSTLDVVCFDIIDLQYRPLPTDILQQPEDRLSLIAERLHSGNAIICTNEDSNIRSDLEAQWNRLLSLTVSLRSPNHTILTAQSADARNPYDFYALASHELRLDVTHDMMTELLFTQALILALSGLIWFSLGRLLADRGRHGPPVTSLRPAALSWSARAAGYQGKRKRFGQRSVPVLSLSSL
jgi:hypothetical protein